MSNAATVSYVSQTGNPCTPFGVYRGFETDDDRSCELIDAYVLRADAERRRATLRPASRRPLIVRRSNRP